MIWCVPMSVGHFVSVTASRKSVDATLVDDHPCAHTFQLFYFFIVYSMAQKSVNPKR